MKVHQNITLNGVDIGENESRKGSKFCNEGKWDNYIKPLLRRVPIVDQDFSDLSFLEIGCNAGLFLRMAKEHGFRDVMGIETWKTPCRMGEMYRDSLGLDYKIINETLNEYDYDFDKLPVADVVLLANLHYHLTTPTLVKLLDALRTKARYVIVVSVEKKSEKYFKPNPRIGATRNYFKDWVEVDRVYPISTEGDPHPREMYSLLFKSNLVRIPLDEIRIHGRPEYRLSKASLDFTKTALDMRKFDVKKKVYFKILMRIKRDPDEKEIEEFLEKKAGLARDIARHGLRTPMLLSGDNYLLDGNHRVITMKAMGYKSIIARII